MRLASELARRVHEVVEQTVEDVEAAETSDGEDSEPEFSEDEC